MRDIDGIVIHYLATPPGWCRQFETTDEVAAEVRRWHVEERGFRDIGYHDVVGLDGSVAKGRPIEEAGAHARGHNARTIGIAYVGGLDEDGNAADTRTQAQKDAIFALIQGYRSRFGDLWVKGHRDLGNTECPAHDARAWWLARKSAAERVAEVARIVMYDAEGNVMDEWTRS